MMNCPSQLELSKFNIDILKCKENYEFWKNEFSKTDTQDDKLLEIDKLSKTVLPCHTLAYENIEKIFFPSDKINNSGLQSLAIRIGGDRTKLQSALHMSDSVLLGHEIFLFAYHGVHNPYHRAHDSPPVRPVGLFLKADIEILMCVHGSPCDIARSNKRMDRYKEALDKFYLCPKDLRNIKSLQIMADEYLDKDFWRYFGNPDIWMKEKGYGNSLFETAGEMRYLNCIKPSDIEAILWPFWSDDEATMNGNWDMFEAFKKRYPDIKTICYNVEKHVNNWALSLVSASYYSQRYYLVFGAFAHDADVAQAKIQDLDNKKS